MKPNCPKCCAPKEYIIRFGFYFRTSDSQKIRRFKCKKCLSHFSSATFSATYRQNKRKLNPFIYKAYNSNISKRRLAIILGVSRTTIRRKFKFLATLARSRHNQWLKEQNFSYMQFDDLETFEHSKCKPVTVTLCVDERRKIIAYRVARIPAKGHLSKVSRKKYGIRKNESFKARDELFSLLTNCVDKRAYISSDMHPQYMSLVKKYFPKATYEQFKSERGAITGQGELKKKKYDPLFKINHTFAMLRANMNRLARRTWCTTKSIEALEDHIALYVDFHNRVLT